MSALSVVLVYGSAMLLAVALLYFFHARWFWHVLGLALAVALAVAPPSMIPLPADWGSARDLVVGFVFFFLIVWGLGSPLFHKHHATHEVSRA